MVSRACLKTQYVQNLIKEGGEVRSLAQWSDWKGCLRTENVLFIELELMSRK